MKIFAPALFMFVLLLIVIPAQGFAQWSTTENFLTLQEYVFSTAHDRNCSFVDEGSVRTLTLYLHHPVNQTFGPLNQERPLTNLRGFECSLELTDGAQMIGWTFPENTYHVGDNNTLVVWYGTPLPVETDPVALGTVEVFFGGQTTFSLPEPSTYPCYILHNVHSFVRSSVPGQDPAIVSFTDADDHQDDPTFYGVSFGDEYDYSWALQRPVVVDAQEHSWDALKAMYR